MTARPSAERSPAGSPAGWPGGGRKSGRRQKYCRQRGFTLLEVMVALVVLSAVGGLVLERTQAITDYHIRTQGHLGDINSLMNDVILFQIRKKGDDDVRLTGDHLELYHGGGQKPLVRIDNFSTTPYSVPLSLGYSPYQVYTWHSDKGRPLSLVMPGLLPKAR